MNYSLSYVLTTFNKLDFLKISIRSLLDSITRDEEIVVVDGGSSDGTFDFLLELFNEGKIQQFISEPDKGEAHGYNKGLLLAKGTLIKVITDDDVFNYSVIRKCRDFMLLHPEVDVMAGNTGDVRFSDKSSIYWNEDFYLDFEKWKAGKLNRFFFNGTCLMLRRTSLPLIGLADAATLLADMEYTLRITGIARLAWCSGLISVRVLNPESNNLVYKLRAEEDSKRLCKFYNYKYPWERKNEELKRRSVLKKMRTFISRLKREFFKLNKEVSNRNSDPFNSFLEVQNHCYMWMQKHELDQSITFYKNDL